MKKLKMTKEEFVKVAGHAVDQLPIDDELDHEGFINSFIQDLDLDNHTPESITDVIALIAVLINAELQKQHNAKIEAELVKQLSGEGIDTDGMVKIREGSELMKLLQEKGFIPEDIGPTKH